MLRFSGFLWTLHKGAATPDARELVEEARRDHHSVFAEAQLVASKVVLAELDGMAKAPSERMRDVMRIDLGVVNVGGELPAAGL